MYERLNPRMLMMYVVLGYLPYMDYHSLGIDWTKIREYFLNNVDLDLKP